MAGEDSPPATDRRRAKFEVVALLLTGGLHLVFEGLLDQKLLFIVLAAVGWCTYLGLRFRAEPELVRAWRLGLRGEPGTAALVAAALGLGILALAGVGAILGPLKLHSNLLFILLLYPVWGWVQQFLLQALFARNLDQLMQPQTAYAAACVCFALVHAPDIWLMAATFGLAAIFIPLYRKGAALIPLGIAHGWLGALFYYWILGRDPWADVVG